MATFFSSLLTSILSFLLLYKYTGLFLVAFISSFALPAPASATLVTGAGFASQGYLNIYAVLGITLLGSMIGDMLGYVIARKYGEAVLTKIPFLRGLMKSRHYEKLKVRIVDVAPSLIFFSRFLPEVNPLTNILSGLTKIPVKKFFAFALLGETVYTLLYGLIGYFLGSQWEFSMLFFAKIGFIILLIGLVLNVAHMLYSTYVKKNKHSA